jgi:hypothetical protein
VLQSSAAERSGIEACDQGPACRRPAGDDDLGGEEQSGDRPTFCSAELFTWAGSTMPASNMSTYSPVEAFMPVPAGSDKTLLRYHAALETGVDRDLHQPRGERHLHDGRVTCLVTGQFSFSKAVPTAFTSATPPPGSTPSPFPAQRRRQ